jgi:hypothetical protein
VDGDEDKTKAKEAVKKGVKDAESTGNDPPVESAGLA